MAATYLDAPGDLLAPEQLTIPKAQELLAAVQRSGMPFVTFVECRQTEEPGACQVVVFDTDVEVDQRPVHDIRRRERIAVVFPIDDSLMPEVLALRADFPAVPHLNLREVELPRSLCLFDRPYEEIRLTWTAMGYLERIREWLARTARGDLHDREQPLEPLLLGSPSYLVLPADLLEQLRPDTPAPLYIYRIPSPEGANWRVLLGQYQPDAGDKRRQLPFVATTLIGAPQTHGLIHRQPRNLKDLQDFLEAASINLRAELKTRLQLWVKDPDLLAALLVIIIALPKTRQSGGGIESVETWAFACSKSVGEIGEELGIWLLHEGVPGTLIGQDPSKDGSRVPVELLSPLYSLDRQKAAQYNGLPAPQGTKIAAVGLGALGSQVFSNLIRTGFGEWALIDPDVLLPHNLARHAMHGHAVGWAKVEGLVISANGTVAGDPIAKGLVADVLRPGAQRVALEDILATADSIIDMSASVPVARHLARDVQSPARRISLYLNPSGSDLVLLAEDRSRHTRLDLLEMQYYRELIHNPRLAGHLQEGHSAVRYGLACRDISAIVPQDMVAVHAGIGARAVRQTLTANQAQAAVWRTNSESLEVHRVELRPWEALEQDSGGWSICTDQWLLAAVHQARREKLPSETGGVLIGAVDMQRHVIYVVDMLPSPVDSIEWPTVYIRGYQDLATEIDRVRKVTAGALGYVGEWHSHPHGHTPAASAADRRALTLLARELAFEGLPALMLIVADHGGYQWYVLRES